MPDVMNIKKIDIHAHATANPAFTVTNHANGYRSLSAEELLAFYERLNIEKGVLLPLISPESQWDIISNQDCKLIAEQYPEHFFWFCSVDPRAGDNNAQTDLTYILQFYQKLGAKGVGELTAQLYADDPRMDNLFSCCEQCGMSVTIHIAPDFGRGYGIVDDLGLPRIERMLKKHPNLKLLGHSTPFWSEISSDITNETRLGYPTGKVSEGRISQLMREYENLYCDLSAGSGAYALMRDPEFAAAFIEEFSDRILYGCDFYAINNTVQFAFDAFLTHMVEIDYISEENYKKIVCGNALKLLNLTI